MYDYPLVRKLLCVLVVVMAPSSIDKVVNMRLKKVSITADRTSPALAAIQDALTLKDLEFELQQKEKLSPEETVEEVSLKGMKISLEETMINIRSKIKIQELALRGEQIDVQHFSDKFISSDKYRNLASVVSVSTSGVNSRVPEQSEKTLNQISLSSSNNEPALNEKTSSGGTLVRVEKNDDVQTGRSLAASESTESSAAVLLASAPVRINGAIELNGGSFTRSESFTYYIERKFKGKTFEAMSLRGDQSDYQIDLLNKKGFMSVELRSPSGEILAYGEADFPESGNNLNLVLEPSAGLFSGQSVEADGFDDNSNQPDLAVADSKTFVAGVDGSLKSDNEGFFGEINLFSKKSEFLSSTIKKNYWPTLSLTEAGKSHYPRLVKRSVIDRLEADLDPFGEAVKIESLLLGKVTFKGLNKEGLKVRVFGQEYQRPIYFSKAGKPNTALEKTSSHGGFVFTNLPDGGYLIQVVSSESVLAQKWFVVRSGHISRGQLDLRERPERLVFLETFPPQAREDKDLEISELGHEESLEVNSLSAELRGVEMPSQTSPSVTVLKVSDSSTRGGVKQLTLISSKSSDVTVKRINESWLSGFLNRQRSNRNNSLGMIAGFVEDSNFELVIEATESLTEKSEIYYFDAQGGSTATGVAGGGFIITNTRLGFQPLVVKLQSENRFLNKIVFTSSKSLSIF